MRNGMRDRVVHARNHVQKQNQKTQKNSGELCSWLSLLPSFTFLSFFRQLGVQCTASVIMFERLHRKWLFSLLLAEIVARFGHRFNMSFRGIHAGQDLVTIGASPANFIFRRFKFRMSQALVMPLQIERACKSEFARATHVRSW